jgi:hypothetical protein
MVLIWNELARGDPELLLLLLPQVHCHGAHLERAGAW